MLGCACVNAGTRLSTNSCSDAPVQWNVTVAGAVDLLEPAPGSPHAASAALASGTAVLKRVLRVVMRCAPVLCASLRPIHSRSHPGMPDLLAGEVRHVHGAC